MKSIFFATLFVLSIAFASCKKDMIVVKEERTFLQKDFVPSGDPIMGGWRLNLRPDGSADILPAGDIVYRGAYKIRSNSLRVETDQAGEFNFKIISDTEIKEEKYGVVLKLK